MRGIRTRRRSDSGRQHAARRALSLLENAYDCIKAFSETDFTEDLKKFDEPTLIIHGDDDQIVPIGAWAHEAAKLIPHATLIVYRGAPHGLADTHKVRRNADVLELARS